MALQATYQNMDGYLLVSVRGEWMDNPAMEIIKNIKSEAERAHQSRVLLNLMEMTPPPDMFSRFRAGEYMAQVWGPSLKVAVVWKQEYINQFAENVAVNRGARLRVFAAEDQALQWLSHD